MKYIPWYEGRYAVTENGEFYSFLNSRWKIVDIPRKLNPRPNKKRWNYLYIWLSNWFWITKNWIAHRLVALTYIPNPNNLPEINHKDGNKNNISVSNLEWCTSSQNKQHAKNILWQSFFRNNPEQARELFSKKVAQYTKDWVFIKEYKSATEASKLFSKSWPWNITSSCRWQTKYAYGFIWKFV